MNEIRIITFDLSYYKQVMELWEKSEGVGLSESDTLENLQFYLEKNSKYSFIVLKGEDVIGTILAGHDGRRGYLYHFLVADLYRKQGIGRKLLQQSIDTLKADGIIKVHIMVYENNELAKTVWSAYGFLLRDDLDIMSFDIK